jgi:MFS family permease
MTKTRFLWWLLFLSVCGSICAGVSQIAITLYAVSLGATSAQLGFIKGLSGIGVFLIVLPMGFLVDHFGAKKIFILGGLIDACVYSAMPFAHTPQNLMLAMAILGFFSSFRSVALNTVFLDKLEIFGSEKAGWNKAAYSVGLAFVGPLLGGYLVKYINYSWTFIFVSALLVVSVVTAVFLLERTQTPKNLEAFSLGEVFRQLQGLFKNKRFLEISGIDALTTALFSCFTVFAVVMALRNFGLSRETAALLVSLEGISYIVALFFLGPLLKLIGYRQTYFFGIFSIIPGLCILAAAAHAFWLWPAAALLGFGIGILGLVNVSQIGIMAGKKGRLAAVNNLFIYIGVIVGPTLGGSLANVFGLQAIFWAFVPLFVILAIRIYLKVDAIRAPVPVEIAGEVL